MESFDDIPLPVSTLPETVSLSDRSAAPPEAGSNGIPDIVILHDSDEAASQKKGKQSPRPESSEPGLNLNTAEDVPPAFPQLLYQRRSSIDMHIPDADGDGADEEPNIAKSFQRSSSPAAAQLSREACDEYPGDTGISTMHKFSLYETSTRYYMVGMDLLDKRFRILKIDRTSGLDDLTVAEDDTVYTKREMNQLLDAVDDGNKSSGGLKLRCSAWGLLGFIKFTGAYYMLLVTKRSQVAMIGGHYIYQIDDTELVPLSSLSGNRTKSDKHAEEARFISIMNNVDLTRSFYFSYSYNITRTLQENIAAERKALGEGIQRALHQNHNSMFVWNDYLLKPAVSSLKNAYDWCLPIIHGYVDQSSISVYGRVVFVTLIARRSRFFAGARFLKRGANDLGYVANDVETEQIVSEMLTTSFHAPGPKLYCNRQYTSYVQHRGSIPLYWTQDNTGVSPKPDIELNLVDPFYSAAALHFNNLFHRYGAPIYVLNLVKSRERVPRESKLLVEYTRAITYLNQFLPDDKKIIYKAWDMSRASKSSDQDVIATLEKMAENIIPQTGFFQNGDNSETGLKMQNGIARTNCIDCLDRTNAAQFVIAKRALGHQLHALGIIDDTSVAYDTDAINMFTNMWHAHGDTIAVQYGGSHLVNTMATYRKLNQWTGHSRDMVESFKRFYNNSFLDAQRQEAYNLFLGNYVFTHDQPMLWDLSTDYHLHHSSPRAWANSNRHNYINWYTPEFLEKRQMPPTMFPQGVSKAPIRLFDDYWLEYYRPLAVSSFSKVFSFKMKSTLHNLPFRSTQQGRYDLSPFVVRADHETADSREKKTPRKKALAIQEPLERIIEDARSSTSSKDRVTSSEPLRLWLQQPISTENGAPNQSSIIKTEPFPPLLISHNSDSYLPKVQNQYSFNQLITDSLNPSISTSEAVEYERYINHPLKVPLVVTSESPVEATADNKSHDLAEYVNKVLLDDAALDAVAEDNLADYIEFLNVGDEGLTVIKEDYDKKRYKRYRQWLRGKSLFKQGIDL
ncbi:phosphatidylinositol-3,5-bisphosphate 5-phosphatase [Ophidiomyces ophidiicola]|uniref:Phosphatidylinositol-3,5-bisphosphate 5-phosphatase n=1 Tax=Ophidiomyces ophidiicola TaxID=1387563 RepID=A0ACB8V524_9EURO|nr:phosphatidylinositol-3,5-bisphosphate 5-phosphatase [Ophidiomyces ophidiicola]KAI1912570.1 phosphatidylinositol-3,5-bisphosphate 5-phosphatase [Ophidiomyces ophidiicola]KAI1918283.1 phosphatidylinositol-3,5-bisphosphate 5-phosphatase [Ophidiomyces ophidiicola]KAI1927556.1 phosphatidylinositol-3,5-bisphosphate 5-phosphatase [Ophidiomyces ophidiicola]KAI1940768.1 phosphatidylinositol-3,5-bisphosphate 5-phosphatase [Ophidiomyces ophidiicola]KAI1951348.1 phosphatidylinositol-3,5-bisphosphate 5-